MSLVPIDRTNWRAAGALRLAPGQLELVAEYEPVAFVILARSYIGYEGGVWHPLAFYVDDAPVGVLALVDEGATWALRSFMVAAEFQGRGYGRAAVVAALSLARSHGATSLRLTVNPANAPARALYESLGFAYGEPRGSDLSMSLGL